MEQWNETHANRHVLNFDNLDSAQKRALLEILNRRFPPKVYEEHRRRRRAALENKERMDALLAKAPPEFPTVIDPGSIEHSRQDLAGVGVVLTAGGEGERLRLSLQKEGHSPEDLKDFTKATFPLPGISGARGALQINLSLLRILSERAGWSIPVVVTTGPAGTNTDRVIGNLLSGSAPFGLEHVRTLAQDERLHLSDEEQIVFSLNRGVPQPVTNPDETGGPLMKLRDKDPASGESALEWFERLGCGKILVLQGTALYDPAMLSAIASAAGSHDGVGVGILRESFPESDPYGTFVKLRTGTAERLQIVEQQWMTPQIRALTDSTGHHLPYNTGFYAFATGILQNNELPDYATSPKEIISGIPRAPKIGFAATDLLPLASSPCVLAVDNSRFAVLKNAGDLSRLSEMARNYKLDTPV